MNDLNLPLNAQIAVASPAEAQPEVQDGPPLISEGEAEDRLEIQAELVENGQRANLNQVRLLAPGNSHFAAVERNARAVGLLVSEVNFGRVVANLTGGGICREGALGAYGHSHDLDSRDMFFSESWWPLSVGTCFLVEDDVVVTALHVIRESGANQALEEGKLRVVFGHEITATGQPANVFCDHRQVFALKKRSVKVAAGDIPAADDWIRLQLVEKATSGGYRSPLSVVPGELTEETPVYSLGHPNGLPLRYVFTAEQLALQGDSFLAFLDAYDRSSGSPVFSAVSHNVVGLVKRSSQPAGIEKVDTDTGLRFISALCLPGFAEEATLCVDSAAFAP